MFHVVALYKFIRIDPVRVTALRNEICAFCEKQEICGLFLIGPEGCNATMAGASPAIEALLAFLQSLPELGPLTAKHSYCEFQPFHQLKVETRKEIVTLKRLDLFPEATQNNHLSPEEWHRIVTSGEDVLLLDTRNTYETEIGKFRGAVNPQIEQFSEFPDFVRNEGIPTEKKILMYCTGGIRCEKALLLMREAGYNNGFQLDGGILNYLEQYPEGEYEGECFVFDQRVAVDKRLRPSQQYRLCPHCGNPGKEPILCANCGGEGIVCSRCVTLPQCQACSKNCAHHIALRQEA